ncbi:uncharacterized protein LOC130047185 [Ostrea edulis]|uniref:uncharacterized protein LOC130047185 n=1 Tax=Ostrea edulis TaxID=37623 RepID=UPI0024AE991B|nr:uncharacterized protein LOC130047185 [Ostrea edulis]
MPGIENTGGSEEISNLNESSCQTHRSWNRRSKSIQTKPKTPTIGTQINMYPARRSVGIQCNIKENEGPMKKEFLRCEDDLPPESPEYDFICQIIDYFNEITATLIQLN